MLKVEELKNYIDGLFETRKTNLEYYNECGITHKTDKTIKRIGYCTNLSLDVIEKAYDSRIDLIITHHDAWDFIYGLKDKCIEKLKEYNIAHYYNHLPLDDSEFGTNATLLKELDLEFEKRNCVEDGFSCGIVGEYDVPHSLKHICMKLEEIMKEPVQCWQFNDDKIKRVQIICGAGYLTSDIKEAIDSNCDLYITGERILSSLEYAQFNKMNMIIGSHTFTELFGVRSLVHKIKDQYKDIELYLIEEEHLEAMNTKRSHVI